MQIKMVPIKSIKPDPENARKHDRKNIEAIMGSLKQFGQQKPIVLDKNGKIIAGSGTLEAFGELGWAKIASVTSDLKTKKEKKAYALADNRSAELAMWDDEMLDAQLVELTDLDFDIESIGFDLPDLNENPEKYDHLVNQFGAPPFSVLDAKQGYWQERKRQWLSLGIQSELGRGGGLTFGDCKSWQQRNV